MNIDELLKTVELEQEEKEVLKTIIKEYQHRNEKYSSELLDSIITTASEKLIKGTRTKGQNKETPEMLEIIKGIATVNVLSMWHLCLQTEREGKTTKRPPEYGTYRDISGYVSYLDKAHDDMVDYIDKNRDEIYRPTVFAQDLLPLYYNENIEPFATNDETVRHYEDMATMIIHNHEVDKLNELKENLSKK